MDPALIKALMLYSIRQRGIGGRTEEKVLCEKHIAELRKCSANLSINRIANDGDLVGDDCDYCKHEEE